MATSVRKPLQPGECRLRLTGYQKPVVQHMVQIAIENPGAFGGLSETGGETWSFRQLGKSLSYRLDQDGEIVLTKAQREFLHTILAKAYDDPVPFGGGNIEWFRTLVLDVKAKLPKRGAGTYNA